MDDVSFTAPVVEVPLKVLLLLVVLFVLLLLSVVPTVVEVSSESV